MFFITNRKHNRLLKEERERGQRLFKLGLRLGRGGKGFITGLQEAECILRDKEI